MRLETLPAPGRNHAQRGRSWGTICRASATFITLPKPLEAVSIDTSYTIKSLTRSWHLKFCFTHVNGLTSHEESSSTSENEGFRITSSQSFQWSSMQKADHRNPLKAFLQSQLEVFQYWRSPTPKLLVCQNSPTSDNRSPLSTTLKTCPRSQAAVSTRIMADLRWEDERCWRGPEWQSCLV